MMDENNKNSFSKDLFKWLWNYSLDYLARFEVSQKKLEYKLMERKDKYPYEVSLNAYKQALQAVTTKLMEQNLLSDYRYGQSRMRQLLIRGKSTYFIKQDLNKNGLNEDLIAQLTEEFNEQQSSKIFSLDELAALQYIKKRHFGCYRLKDSHPKQQQKELAALARQGFSYDLAQKMLQLEYDEAEEGLNDSC
ncbi:MAG: regulatory protein RecX [Alphaproteobacteria bacterium]